MLTLTATDAKTRFGQVLQSAMVEPVAIEKNGTEMAFVLSSAAYHRMQDAEDALWALKAQAAEADGFLSQQQAIAWQERMRVQLGGRQRA